MVKYKTNKLFLIKLAFILVLSFQDTPKKKFPEMIVKSKKGIKRENLLPTEGSAWQYSLKFTKISHNGKYYTIQPLIQQNGAGNSQRIA